MEKKKVLKPKWKPAPDIYKTEVSQTAMCNYALRDELEAVKMAAKAWPQYLKDVIVARAIEICEQNIENVEILVRIRGALHPEIGALAVPINQNTKKTKPTASTSQNGDGSN